MPSGEYQSVRKTNELNGPGRVSQMKPVRVIDAISVLMDDRNRIISYCPGLAEEIRIRDLLNSRGYNVFTAGSLPSLLNALCQHNYDLALFSFASGQENITDLPATVRSLCNLPVIFLVAADAPVAFPGRVKNCYDDFIKCPLNEEELILRIERVLSCHAARKISQKIGVFSIGMMSFDPVNRILHTPDGNHSLTGIESKLLHLLCLHGKNILSRELALETIWGENDYFKARSMDVYVTRLRKLFRSDTSVTLSNIHNVGFRLNVKEKKDGKNRQ